MPWVLSLEGPPIFAYIDRISLVDDAHSLMGKYPEEAVMMLAKIAAFTESHRPRGNADGHKEDFAHPNVKVGRGHRMASVIEHALETVPCDMLLVPTDDGTLARVISRCKPGVWIVAPSTDKTVCQGLTFSYGVYPVDLAVEPEDWHKFATGWLHEYDITAEHVMLVIAPSPGNPDANHRLELMNLGEQHG